MSAPPVIVRVLARMNVGGPARQVIELARGLRPRGFETLVVTGEPGPGEGDLRGAAERAGVRVVTIGGLAAAVRPGRDLRALAEIIGVLRRERPAVVHTHTAKAGALGRLAARAAGRIPCVHTFHGTVFDGYFSPWRSRWVVRAERLLARTTDRIVAVSHAVADELEAAGLDAAKIRVIEPVIDLEPFLAIGGRSRVLRRELGVADDETLLGWIGRLVPIKDPVAFADAFAHLAAELPKLRGVLVGAGPLEGSVRERIASLGLDRRVALLPFREAMASVYADLDVLVSTSRKEGMPVVVLEAMAAGVPVAATAVGGAPELIADERSGFLLEPGDPAAIARGLRRALEMTAQGRLVLRGVARVRARERFGPERGLDRHAMLYREILEGS